MRGDGGRWEVGSRCGGAEEWRWRGGKEWRRGGEEVEMWRGVEVQRCRGGEVGWLTNFKNSSHYKNSEKLFI